LHFQLSSSNLFRYWARPDLLASVQCLFTDPQNKAQARSTKVFCSRTFTTMLNPATLPNTADQDRVMSWLQDVEMRDHKLGAARSTHARIVDIRTAIDRLLGKACITFPNVESSQLAAFLHDYIDPLDRLQTRAGTGSIG